jgi:hypothetical protein
MLFGLNRCGSFCLDVVLEFHVSPVPQQRNGNAYYRVDDEEHVGGAVEVDNHVAANLPPFEIVPPYLEKTHEFECRDVEDKDAQGVVAAIDEETLDDVLAAVNRRGYRVYHEETYDARHWQRGNVVELGREVHTVEFEVGTGAQQHEEHDGLRPVFAELVLILAVEYAKREEEYAPTFAYAALNDSDDFQPVVNLEQRYYQGKCADDERDSGLVEPALAVVQQQVQHEKHYARDKQCPEEPERSGEELVVAAHREDNAEHALNECLPVVGVGYPVLPVAELLIEDAHLEKQVVDDEEEQAPFDERDVKPLETLLAERPRVIEILLAEEIPCRDEENGHVEQIDEIDEQLGTFGVSHYHQYDGYALAD